MVGTWLSFGIAHRLVRAELGGLPVEPEREASMIRRLAVGAWLAIGLAVWTSWAGISLAGGSRETRAGPRGRAGGAARPPEQPAPTVRPLAPPTPPCKDPGMDRFTRVADRLTFSPEKMKKAALVDTPSLFCDAYCFEPGQEQVGHRHAVGDKLYYVVSGAGRIRVGSEERDVGSGDLVCAPAGEEHGVHNPGPGRLVLLVMM